MDNEQHKAFNAMFNASELLRGVLTHHSSKRHNLTLPQEIIDKLGDARIALHVAMRKMEKLELML